MTENENKKLDDTTFRIQERMLREARQSLADVREELAEAQAIRKERDTLRIDIDDAWRQVSLEKLRVEDFKGTLAISNKQLIEQRDMVTRLKQRLENVNAEYNNAYGTPITEERIRRTLVYDPNDFKSVLDADIPTFRLAPDTKIEIKNDHHN